MKLPVDIQNFLNGFGDERFFVTSLDGSVAQIYPESIWGANEELLNSHTENPEAAENILFTAADLGADAEMDSQGRIGFCAQLRRELQLEATELKLQATGSRVEVYTDAIYREKKARAARTVASNVDQLRRAGLR